MDFFKRHKFEAIVLIVLTLIYFVSRFYSILSLPIFTDEAIYIRWAQIAKQDANWRFISLTDGKQPMLIWLMMIALRFVQDPLLAGRVVSVGAGFLTLIGMYFLGKEIFRSNKIGLISSALYVIFPMALVYDRMALYDSLVGTFAVWALLLVVLLIRKIRLDIALIFGMVVGGGVLTKTNAFFSLYLLPASLILLDWKEKGLRNRLTKWLFLVIIAVVIVYGFYFILRLSPFFHIISEKNAIFVYPFKEWLKHPLEFFIGNWKALWDWTIRYLTWPFFALAIASFFLSKSFLREKIVLFLWFIIPIVALGLFGKTLFPRFIFFMILPLLPLIAFSLVNIYTKFKMLYVFLIFLFLVFVLAFKTDYLILKDFANAQIPISDRNQYLTDWPAGGGVNGVVEFFKREVGKGKIYVATQGTFGLMPYALEIYLVNNPNIKIDGYWPVGDVIPAKAIEKSKKIPTYFLFYQPCSSCVYPGAAPVQWNLNPVLRIKGAGDNYTSIYRIK
ncbi:MAG: Dolichyl-phosphate-mannose-protein mannosyltransferase [Candidatus Levybacteria bacterium GW2011_GWA1_37_16]|nr:MAG: Dolichyl-phosphate-mannose-protein mannosyltransferase [Candidatus Levybacteria bacterium GW2011_GWA1_37_16]KKQ36752.1 MAG: Dolichyl-phosphate-mannose-protein mannosyltransferase [Candidatus Levybacteria bacterium GW2011_GWC2_37_7]KKQ42355.1 MAG: Dolichyl-phosphate-mannose-protein mannosyltransferase [Candidatus Levybacteria bacterium GW2011_GWB1_37_8]